MKVVYVTINYTYMINEYFVNRCKKLATIVLSRKTTIKN